MRLFNIEDLTHGHKVTLAKSIASTGACSSAASLRIADGILFGRVFVWAFSCDSCL